MAKQLVGPLERHAEKIVLGIAGLVLIGVIARFLVTSPNQLELGGETVSPRTIDAKVAGMGRDKLARLRQHEVDPDKIEPLEPAFEQTVDPFTNFALARELPGVAPLHPEVPVVGYEGGAIDQLELPVPLAMGKPVVTTGRSTLQLTIRNPGGEGEDVIERPVAWATVAASFDRFEQYQRHKEVYQPGKEEVLIAGAELQRRRQHPDGSWSDEDWEMIPAYYDEVTPPKIPEVPLERDGERIFTSGATVSNVEDYASAIKSPETRREAARPPFAVVLNGSPWQMPRPEGISLMDVRRQDDELRYPDELPAAIPECLYEECSGEEEEKEPTEEVSPRDQIERIFKKGQDYYDQAKKTMDSTEGAIDAHNTWADILNHMHATARDKKRAEQLIAKANQLERDIQRKIERERGNPNQPGKPQEAAAGPKRQLLPVQLLWSHDVLPGSLRGGANYQYRIRALVFNQYAASPKKLKNPEDATKVLLAGAWSEPSDPVYIEPVTRYFITTAKEHKNEIKVEFYQWFDGVWVNGKSDFSIGDRLRHTERAEIPLKDGEPWDVDRPLVDFVADAVVLDVDFKYSQRDRKRSGRGVKYDRVTEATIVILADSEGNVFERVVEVDKNDPERKTVKARVWEPAPKPKEKKPVPGQGQGLRPSGPGPGPGPGP